MINSVIFTESKYTENIFRMFCNVKAIVKVLYCSRLLRIFVFFGPYAIFHDVMAQRNGL